MQRLEGAELLGDQQRRVVGQHDAARTESDRGGVRGDVGDQHAGRRRRDRVHVVVLGVPDPAKSPSFGPLGDADGGVESFAHGLALADDGEIEDGQRHGGRAHAKHNPRSVTRDFIEAGRRPSNGDQLNSFLAITIRWIWLVPS